MPDPAHSALAADDGVSKAVQIDVSIVIISYNTRDMTLACVESVYKETRYGRFEVIVVDNASTDGSAEAIAQSFSQVKLIASEENLGFAKANNVAARDANGTYLLLLNPDTVVLNGAIDAIVEFALQHPKAKIYGGRTFYADGSLNPSSCWGRMTLWSLFCTAVGFRRLFSGSRFFNPEYYGNWKRDTIREVDIVTGCFFLIRREVWNQLGGFGPRYFMYGEEADLCIRAQRLGARPIIFPDATIIHHGSASDPIASEKRIAVLRAKVTLMQDHWSFLNRFLGKNLFLLHILASLLIFGTLARIFGAEFLVKKAKYYAEVWKERKLWLAGYS